MEGGTQESAYFKASKMLPQARLTHHLHQGSQVDIVPFLLTCRISCDNWVLVAQESKASFLSPQSLKSYFSTGLGNKRQVYFQSTLDLPKTRKYKESCGSSLFSHLDASLPPLNQALWFYPSPKGL